MAGTTRLELPTPAVTGQRSNQLNYVPTRQINKMRNNQCLCGFAQIAYLALFAQNDLNCSLKFAEILAGHEINSLHTFLNPTVCYHYGPCSTSSDFGGAHFPRCFRSRQSLLLENLALRQQLAVLKRRHPRPKLSPLDKLFWALPCQFWSAWKQALMVVTPETVVRWHRAGFRLYWRLISRVRSASRKEETVQGGPASDLPNGGLASMDSGFGGMLFTLITGWLVDHYSYTPVFIGFGLLPLICATILWLLVSELRPIGVRTTIRGMTLEEAIPN